MTKSCALLVLCLLWITPAVSQTKTDKDRENLAGPVKRVEAYLIDIVSNDNGVVEKRHRWYTTAYNTEGNISKRTSYDQNGEIIAINIHTYDANGRSTGYDEYARLGDKTLTSKRPHVYKLNEDGRRIEYTVFESNGSVGTRFVYIYDAQGNLIEEHWYAHTGLLAGRMVFTFDEKGNRIGEASYEEDGTLSWKNTSKYDANGHKTEWIQHHGNTLRYKMLYSYDSKGRVLETETLEFNGTPNVIVTHAPEPGRVVNTYDDDKRTKEVATYRLDGTLKEKVAHAYDERGNEVGVTTFNADGSVKNSQSVLFKIEYDSHGNWTRKTRLTHSEKGGPPQPYHAELRVITYY